MINFLPVCRRPSRSLVPAPAAWCITPRSHNDHRGFSDSLRDLRWVCSPAALEGPGIAASKHQVWGETRTPPPPPPSLYHHMEIRTRIALFPSWTKEQQAEVWSCTRSYRKELFKPISLLPAHCTISAALKFCYTSSLKSERQFWASKGSCGSDDCISWSLGMPCWQLGKWKLFFLLGNLLYT